MLSRCPLQDILNAESQSGLFPASLGGLLGLFIGFSLTGGAEILYFFTFRLYYKLRSHATVQVSSSPPLTRRLKEYQHIWKLFHLSAQQQAWCNRQLFAPDLAAVCTWTVHWLHRHVMSSDITGPITKSEVGKFFLHNYILWKVSKDFVHFLVQWHSIVWFADEIVISMSFWHVPLHNSRRKLVLLICHTSTSYNVQSTPHTHTKCKCQITFVVTVL